MGPAQPSSLICPITITHTHTHTSWHLNRPSVLGMQDHRLCFFFISLLSLFEYVLHDEGSTGECRHRLVGGSQLQFKVNTWLFEDTSSCWGSGWSAVTVSVLHRHFEVKKTLWDVLNLRLHEFPSMYLKKKVQAKVRRGVYDLYLNCTKTKRRVTELLLSVTVFSQFLSVFDARNDLLSSFRCLLTFVHTLIILYICQDSCFYRLFTF